MHQLIVKEVFNPNTCRQEFAAKDDAWLYRYRHSEKTWQLSIATYAKPQSGSLSLGGFRIAPASRTKRPNYDNDREAVGLATGMEGKVFWSRLIQVGGPLGLKQVHRIAGGKCVLFPSADARVGQPHDFELLDFATDCLHDFENTTGIHITTGQDLGHGLMSDGKTHSLDYLHQRFAGSVRANTAGPTGEGNYALLKGMLKGLGLRANQTRVGLIGCGNVGGHVLGRLHHDGVEVFGLDAYEPKRQKLSQSLGISMWAPEQKPAFLEEHMDALVVNASGGSLDGACVQALCQNQRVKVVCGCENLAMPNSADADRLAAAGKLFAPTQLGGMFGYLTAVEEYLCANQSRPFAVKILIKAAAALEQVGQRGAEQVVAKRYQITFEQALKDLYK